MEKLRISRILTVKSYTETLRSFKRGKSCFEKLSEICPMNLSTRGLSLD